ncbi:hypothetical protein DWV12_13475 [Clostridium botulinum]|uniref:hypothetical protein n=1 Tax=Clostridium botulinum TaxID=1491 RepID=UPI00217EB373|nr:hypothetical protein [Clostridium botulinum]MCS6105068.1 hypothetical protein [Clostridium botulinum]MCS6108368.1 hypothetical protein [Clostridium botulinum]
MKETIMTLKVIVDFFSQLTEEQISDIINNKAKLKLEYRKAKDNKKFDIKGIREICKKLENINSRDEGIKYLKSLNIRKNELKAIGKEYNIPFTTRDTNAQLIDKIIEGLVGAKLRFDALLNTNLSK